MDFEDEDVDSIEESEEEEENLVADSFDFLKVKSSSSSSPGLVCELKLYEARYNIKGERKLNQVGKHKDREPQTHRDHASAMTFTRWYDWEKTLERTELVIRSPYLLKALREVIKEYPGVNLKTGNIVIKDLPKCLFHYRDQLQQYGLTLQFDGPDFQHLLLLLRHMWEQLESQWNSYYNLMENPLLAPGLEFAELWMAFRPGDQLYMKVLGEDRIVRMKQMTKCRETWRITYDYIADDGDDLGYVQSAREIETYEGYRPLDNLAIFPLEYHPEKDAVTKTALERGKKMVALRGVHYCMYTGKIEALGASRANTFIGQVDVFPLQTTSIKSRVMIDARTFGRINPSNTVSILDGVAGRLPKIYGTDMYDLSDEHFLICDHQVAGFSLADKSWCWLDVAKITDIEFNTRAYDNLLLPQDQKDMIFSLVGVHTNNNLSFDDVIKGKGKGMVFLLHGVPGVGKTLTAESVADQTRQPLYTISCGELGTEPSAVERKLKAALDLATTWNAIALIDEADIFLEARSMHDLERNSLVSTVFLRLLEYYEGILFLTTNRIEAFDPAFKSRIHLAVKYHPLTLTYRINLWKSFIANTTGVVPPDWPIDDILGFTYGWLTNEYLLEIGKEDLNGRQIKNTVRTAHALAVSAGVPLSDKHINTALKAMRLFEADFMESSGERDREVSAKRRRT
ncbi:P-loop containing nucleoside triphosphate hydrolase protein [Hyaloscypha finlandica]|nr:P-loop containing nucleoside triphosphate hydrolase protein [Hyaloscypha finlandica]